MMQYVHVKLRPGVSWQKQHSIIRKYDLHLRNKLVKCYTWSVVLYAVENWTLRKADQIYLESSET